MGWIVGLDCRAGLFGADGLGLMFWVGGWADGLSGVLGMVLGLMVGVGVGWVWLSIKRAGVFNQ